MQFLSKIVVDEAIYLLTTSRNISSDFMRFPGDFTYFFPVSFYEDLWMFSGLGVCLIAVGVLYFQLEICVVH